MTRTTTTQRPTDAELVELLRQGMSFADVMRKRKGIDDDEREFFDDSYKACKTAADALEATPTLTFEEQTEIRDVRIEGPLFDTPTFEENVTLVAQRLFASERPAQSWGDATQRLRSGYELRVRVVLRAAGVSQEVPRSH